MKTDYRFLNALRLVLGLEPLGQNGRQLGQAAAPAARRPQHWRRAQQARRAAIATGWLGLAGCAAAELGTAPDAQLCVSAGRGPAPACGFGKVAICIQPEQDPYSARWICVAR